MEGVIYVMENACFMVKDHYKIGFTTNLEERKNAYRTAYPSICEWPYVSEVVSNIRTRERLIFQRLKEYRFNDSREFFICPIEKIRETIESVNIMTLKDMNLELNIKEWTLEILPFLKKTIKKTNKSTYEKVLVNELHRMFIVWCTAKNIKKKVNMDDFYTYLEDKNYKIKTSKNNPDEYLEKIEYKL